MGHWHVTVERTCFTPKQIPPPTLPEIAVAGRSNVGKSTLINALLGTKLAHVSGSPGKTRSINFFRIQMGRTDQAFFLVDLPGYGYAKRGLEERRQWGQLIEGYVAKRDALCLVLQLVDFRHGFLENDLMMQDWLRDLHLPGQVVFTKADKIARAHYAKLCRQYTFPDMVSTFPPLVTGAARHVGVPELRLFLEERVREHSFSPEVGVSAQDLRAGEQEIENTERFIS